MTIRHAVTRHAITLVCLEATRVRGRFKSVFYSQGKWVTAGEVAAYPVSTPQRKLMNELANPQRRLF
jgi:A/G-specific adenine glycosylase